MIDCQLNEVQKNIICLKNWDQIANDLPVFMIQLMFMTVVGSWKIKAWAASSYPTQTCHTMRKDMVLAEGMELKHCTHTCQTPNPITMV